MKILLDTHIWIWGFIAPEKIGVRLRRQLGDPRNELWLSAINVWEYVLLSQKGRLKKAPRVASLIDESFRKGRFKEVPLSAEIALETGNFELPHLDPADRFLVATARVHGLALATADEKLIDSGAVTPILANR